jgi:hypothetical protein
LVVYYQPPHAAQIKSYTFTNILNSKQLQNSLQ